MRKRPGLAGLAIIPVLLGMSDANANTVDRDLIEAIPIAAISLDYPAETAFYSLLTAGYTTDVTEYEDWWEPARSFVKGDPSAPSGSPDGYSEIVLKRNRGRLISISLTSINPRSPFNTAAEIGRVRDYFGIPVDASRCYANPVGASGFCVAQDADETATYSLQLLGDTQRYETAALLDSQAVGYEAPPPEDTEVPLDMSGLEFLEAAPDTDDNVDPCSLNGLRAALNPLLPELEAEIDRLASDFLRDNPGSRSRAPAHYAESQLSGNLVGSAMNGSWCTSPFAVSDVEWMAEQNLIGVMPKRDAALAEHMDEAIAATGLTEAQIREIFLNGNVPAGVTPDQAVAVYTFMKQVGQREIALEVRDSSLVFWLFSPNLLTERVGFMGGDQNLNKPVEVITRHGHHLGWEPTITANLIVGLADPRRDRFGNAQYDPNDFSFVQPGARLTAYAMSRPPHDPTAVSSSGNLYQVPETTNAIVVYDSGGGFVRYACDGKTEIKFYGEQFTYWGFLEGELRIDANWDPASPWVEGELYLASHNAWRQSTRYSFTETGDPDCPYQPAVTDEISGDSLSLRGRVRIPNQPDLPPRVPGTKGRTVQVGPNPPE